MYAKHRCGCGTSNAQFQVNSSQLISCIIEIYIFKFISFSLFFEFLKDIEGGKPVMNGKKEITVGLDG